VTDASSGGGPRRPAAILDIDGTLVDTNFHHAIAWFRAFRRLDVTLPLYRIHRHIGMGSDQLVGALAGEEWDARHGDDVRERESEEYMDLIDEVRPLDGARDLLVALGERGHALVLASSAKPHEVDHYLDLLDARELVAAAVEKAGGGRAVMLGDSTWDCEAARRAGVATVGVLTGGFSEQELMEAGAERVVQELRELLDDLDATPFAAL
jgi:phosphoglycolate phosphatase-like HAD superfamily hydrolase